MNRGIKPKKFGSKTGFRGIKPTYKFERGIKPLVSVESNLWKWWNQTSGFGGIRPLRLLEMNLF